jgi:hypothetical protein
MQKMIGYKLKDSSKIWEFSKEAKQATLALVKPAVRELFRRVINEPNNFRLDPVKLKEKAKLLHTEREVRFWVAWETITEAYKKQKNFLTDNPANFDALIGFWELESSVYLSPYSAYKYSGENIFKHLETSKYLEPFSFDESAETLVENGKKVTKKKLEERSSVWSILKTHHWYNNLKLNICSTTNMEEFIPNFPDDCFTEEEALEIVGKR